MSDTLCGCPPAPNCMPCPIIVSCDANLALPPGQLQYCPASGKYSHIIDGVKQCLNVTFGRGLARNSQCLVEVALPANGPIVFDVAGNLTIDCAKLISCCNLVDQVLLATVVQNIFTSVSTQITNIVATIPKVKKCGGTDLLPAEQVFTVGSLKKKTAAGLADLACGDVVVTWDALLKCVNGVTGQLDFGAILATTTCVAPVSPTPPVSPTVPVAPPPVAPPPVSPIGGCCDLSNSGPKNYISNITTAGTELSGSAPIWAFSFPCGANGYVPFATSISAGSLPPGKSVNGVAPNSDGNNNYYFQGFSGNHAAGQAVGTYTYQFTFRAQAYSGGSGCESSAAITWTVNVTNGGSTPVSPAVADGGGGE